MEKKESGAAAKEGTESCKMSKGKGLLIESNPPTKDKTTLTISDHKRGRHDMGPREVVMSEAQSNLLLDMDLNVDSNSKNRVGAGSGIQTRQQL